MKASRSPDMTAPHTPPPPEPPSPPATAYITLRRTGNPSSDFERLSSLHKVLKTEKGSDDFVVVLESDGRDKVELAFPNEHTRLTSSLRQQIVSIVGDDNLRVVQQTGSW